MLYVTLLSTRAINIASGLLCLTIVAGAYDSFSAGRIYTLLSLAGAATLFELGLSTLVLQRASQVTREESWNQVDPTQSHTLITPFLGHYLVLICVQALLLLVVLLPVGLWESPWHVILPAVTLAFSPGAYLARLTRASVLEVVEKDWVRTARSKGLSEQKTILRHILRNSLMPVVTVLGPLTAIVITGSFVVEYIFAIPGMGRFFITAVMNRDYDLILGTTMVFAVLLIVANMFVDIVYQWLDPRLRME